MYIFDVMSTDRELKLCASFSVGTCLSCLLRIKSVLQHNFTDGMSLGTAFLLHGTVGGWSRTLFLLAHELPQEVDPNLFYIYKAKI